MGRDWTLYRGQYGQRGILETTSVGGRGRVGMKYHREGKNHLLLLHLIIPTKKWSRAYIFKYQLTHLDFNESENDKPPSDV